MIECCNGNQNEVHWIVNEQWGSGDGDAILSISIDIERNEGSVI